MTTPANQPDLVAFLRAQLDDDERIARDAMAEWPGDWQGLTDQIANRSVDLDAAADHMEAHSPARVLAEVDAMRRILDLVTECGPEWGDGYTEAYRDVVRLLALPFAGHPDYRDEWRPA